MQSKRWRILTLCCVIIHLTFLISSEEYNNKGENMNIKEMEIILDHNLSEEDLRVYNPGKLTRDRYIIKKYSNFDIKTAQDEAYEVIYDYYRSKNDKKNAEKYFNKLSKERQERIEKAKERRKKQNRDSVKFEGIHF